MQYYQENNEEFKDLYQKSNGDILRCRIYGRGKIHDCVKWFLKETAMKNLSKLEIMATDDKMLKEYIDNYITQPYLFEINDDKITYHDIYKKHTKLTDDDHLSLMDLDFNKSKLLDNNLFLKRQLCVNKKDNNLRAYIAKKCFD